jgi:hypothetical protein
VSIRLIQQACSSQWLGLEDSFRMLPGPLFEVNQQTAEQPASATTATARAGEDGGAEWDERVALPIALVVFVGGCTSAEVSALRWLGQRPGAPRRFIVLTTNMCTGTSLMNGLIDRVENNLTFGPARMGHN